MFFEYSVLKEHFKTVFASHHSGTINYRVVFFSLSLFSAAWIVCFFSLFSCLFYCGICVSDTDSLLSIFDFLFIFQDGALQSQLEIAVWEELVTGGLPAGGWSGDPDLSLEGLHCQFH